MSATVRPRGNAPAVADLDELFRGFADPTRIRILNVLTAGELCVCDVVTILDIAQPTVSRHLAYLRAAGLVVVTRQSKFAHYRLADPGNEAHAGLLDYARRSFSSVRSLDAERQRAVKRVREREADPC